jgi:hypothetical protein
MQLVSGARHPVEIQSFVKAFEGAMPCSIEEPPTHSRPGNRPYFSCIEFRHTALDLGRPRGLGIFIHFAVKALDQRRRERRAGVAGKRQGVLENLCDITLHAGIVTWADQVIDGSTTQVCGSAQAADKSTEAGLRT